MAGEGRRRCGGGNAGVAAILLLCVAMISGCRAWDCSVTDKAVLLSFKSYFVDNAGVFSTWQSNSSNCCTWTGVTCRESDGAVLELAVVGVSGSANPTYSNSGSVGSGLIALTHLQKLKIQWVLFNRGIPSEWGEFSDNLIWITVNYANLRGDIPSNLANINNLQRLDLKQNHLTGSIPSTFCTHQKINYIDVSYNDMSYLLVPACLQGQNNITIIYGGQGQSSSPGSPGAGSMLTVATSLVLGIGALSSAFLLS